MYVYSWIPSEFKIAIVRIRKKINDLAMKLFVQVVRETWTVFKTLPIFSYLFVRKREKKRMPKAESRKGTTDFSASKSWRQWAHRRLLSPIINFGSLFWACLLEPLSHDRGPKCAHDLFT